MRILQYLSRFRARDGGVPRSVLDLCAALAARSHAVTLLTGGDELVPAAWRAESAATPGAQPRVVMLRPWRAMRRLHADERDAIDRALHDCDIAHLHVPWDQVGVRIATRARAAGRPYLVTAHGMLDDWTMAHRPLRKRLFLAAGGRRCLERAAAVHCTSITEEEQSRRWFPRGRTAVAPLLTDLAPFADEPALPPRGHRQDGGHLQVLFLGRLDPIKGVEDLLHAAVAVRDAKVRIGVLIAGDGDAVYRRSLELLSAQLKLSPIVRFLGHVGGETKLRLLRSADVSVLPSRHENFGVALIESLAAGTPVLITEGVNIWRELVASGGAVVVPAPKRSARPPTMAATAIAAALVDLASDRARLHAMGERGRAWVLDELSANRVIARYEAMYAEGGR